MDDITLDQSARVPETVVVQELSDGEAVLLNLENDEYYGLDATGARIWQAITTEPTLGAALQLCLEEYDVTPERLQHDICNLVRRLIDSGLLSVSKM